MPRVKLLMLVKREKSKETLQRLNQVLTDECGVTEKRLMLVRPLKENSSNTQDCPSVKR